MPRRRIVLKWMHWTMLPLLVWFTLVQPKDVTPFGSAAFQAHSLLALVFVTIALFWTGDYLWRGLVGRAGPKLSPRLQWLHRIMHRTIIWGLFIVALTGFLLGLTSHTLLKAGGILPIAPPLGMRAANEWIGLFHTVQFYALSAFIALHGGFHIWRHVRLHDNALRIMVPKRLHRLL